MNELWNCRITYFMVFVMALCALGSNPAAIDFTFVEFGVDEKLIRY